MRELSMHILDIAQNSIVAGATRIGISVYAETKIDFLRIAIWDNGKGMSEEQLAKVKDPLFTTRTTRRVGLGIPMFAEAARACNGHLEIASILGCGTSMSALFELGHIDRAPFGDIAATLISLIAANPDITFFYEQQRDAARFVLKTNEVKEQLDGVPITEPSVLKWLGEYIREQTSGAAHIE